MTLKPTINDTISFRCFEAFDASKGNHSFRFANRKLRFRFDASQLAMEIVSYDLQIEATIYKSKLRFHCDASKASTHRKEIVAFDAVYSGRRKLRSSFRFSFDASKQNRKNRCQGYFNDASKQNRKDQPISGETSYIAPPTNASGKDLGRYLHEYDL